VNALQQLGIAMAHTQRYAEASALFRDAIKKRDNSTKQGDAFDGKPDMVVDGLSTIFVLLNSTVSVPGFTISAAAPSPASVTAGGSATTTVTVTYQGGFNQSVALTCGSIILNGAPATTASPSCKFNPSSVSNASGTSTLTISTTGPSAALAPAPKQLRGLFYAMVLPVLAIVLTGTGFRLKGRRLLGIFLVCMTISALLFLAACGGENGGGGNSGGGGGGTPAGTYTISISGAAGPIVNTLQLTEFPLSVASPEELS
jgi:hypothetical protein